MNNRELAEVFTLIADLSEIKGEIVYKTLAYRRAAETLSTLGRDVNEHWKEGTLREIPGVGQAIAEKIDELLRTGRLKALEKLEQEVPAALAEWLKVPGLGPKKVALIHKTLEITTLAELEKAARAGGLRELPGMGAKSEAQIIAGIESLSRRSSRIPLGRAYPLAQQIVATLKKVPGVVAAEPAGSLRRMRATVGDLDILVAAADAAPVMEVFTTLPGVVRVLGKGETKSSIEFGDGVRAQVWVHPPEKFGTALQYATGSKEHNIRLREIALDKGLSLSEHALTRTDGSGEILCATEEKVYETLGLVWVPPELREDRGEVQAARKGQMPRLVELRDIRADLQTHSTWSDGKLSMLEMARAAARRGIKVIAFTDHSASLGMVGGLTMEDHARQQKEIEQAQAEAGGHDPHPARLGGRDQGRRDSRLSGRFPCHAGPGRGVTAHLAAPAAGSRHRAGDQGNPQPARGHHRPPDRAVDPGPRGRGPGHGGRAGRCRRESGVALEINAHPARLDLEDVYAERAKKLGILLSINTDAHSEADLDMLHFGVAMARRAWLEPQDVINTWPTEKLLDWLSKRGG